MSAYEKPSIEILGLEKERNRLRTFENWNVPTTDKRLLAKCGFYYIGRVDLVKCYFCKIEIGMWQPEDNPVEEHLRWSPNCSLLHGRETTNEPIDYEPSKQSLLKISMNAGVSKVQKVPSRNSWLNMEINRLSTYQNWHLQTPDKETLAKTGFYCTGQRDMLRCHFCSVEIGGWKPEDDPFVEHSAFSPKCPLLRGEQTANIPLSTQEPHDPFEYKYPELMKEPHRMMTFEDWPHVLKQKPADLAAAGFFYTGKGDGVTCFSCGGDIKQWEETDVPWEKHALLYNDCEYLKFVKGQEFVDKVLAGKNSIPTSNSEISDTSNDKMCKICYERDYAEAFIPCGHIIACDKCALKVKTCPCCREPVLTFFKIFVA